MKRYTDRKETPLSFHHFIHYVWLPLHSTYLVYTCYTIFNNNSIVLNTLSLIFILYIFSILLLSVMAFIGFFSWKKYAFRSIIAIMVMASVFNILVSFLDYYFRTSPSSQTYYSNYFTFIIVFAIPTIIYYQKRKLLFSNAAGVTEETTTFIDPAKIDPSALVAHTSSQQDDTTLTASQAFSIHQSECIRAYPDFNYNEEMNNKKTGEIFSKLLDSGVDMKTAYEFVHRNDPMITSKASSADNSLK